MKFWQNETFLFTFHEDRKHAEFSSKNFKNSKGKKFQTYIKRYFQFLW